MKFHHFVFVAFFILFNFFEAKSQNLHLVTKYHEMPPHKEVYYVLKSNKKIKHGRYKLIVNDLPQQAGYYKNNLKDSLWVEFFPGTKEFNTYGFYKAGLRTGLWNEYGKSNLGIYLSERGYYEKGKRVGRWPVFTPSGDSIFVLNYSTNQLTFYNQRFNQDKLWPVKTIHGFEKMHLDQPPVQIDKMDGQPLRVVRLLQVKYPVVAMRSGTFGKVVIGYTVDENGNEVDFEPESNVGNGCEEEIIRVLKVNPGKWVPAMLNGKPVPTKHTFEFGFRVRE